MKQATMYALKNKTSNVFIHYTESGNGKWCSIGPKEERLWVVEDEYVAQNALQKILKEMFLGSNVLVGLLVGNQVTMKL
jgi:hypothetical protein